MSERHGPTLVVTRHGGPEVTVVEDRPAPDPGPGEALVEVEAVGVNFIDVYQREGVYPTSPPFVACSEGAGTVVALGEGAAHVGVGDRVAWAMTLGSGARYAALPAETLVRVPDAVDLETAAAVMLQGMTAHYLVTSTYRVEEGTTALVHAAAVREATGGRGVDVAYDGVGKDTFDASLASLRPRGTLALFGAASGQVPPLDLQRLNSGGSLFVTRPSLGHHLATREELEWRAGEVLAAVADGSLRVEVGGRYPFAEAARAYEDLEGRRTRGKLLLIP